MSQSDKEDKESLARSQLPYKAEYCKTSRAKCKKCQEPMMANSLKLASMVKSRFHDGYDATFFHVTCFFQMKRPSSVAEIGRYETLKYDDQKMLEEAIKSEGLSVLGELVKIETKAKAPGKTAKDKKSKKRVKDEMEDEGDTQEVLCNYDDFSIEYAKSSRSKCVKCEGKIEKETVRLSKLDYEAENQWTKGPIPRWYHVDCFAKALTQVKFFGNVTKIKGFGELEEDDQKMLKDKIKPISLSDFKKELETKKLKTENNGSQADKDKMVEEERKLKKQSDKFFALREQVDKMKRKDIEEILSHMKQKSDFRNPSQLVDALTDVLMFGPIEKCPQCKKRRSFILKSGEYICTSGGDSDPCTYETREPKRGLPDIPDELTLKYPYFEYEYKFKGGARLFATDFIKAVEQKEAEVNKIVQKGAPLDGLNIGVISWKNLNTDKTKVQNKVMMLGGQLMTSLDSSLFIILASEEQLEKDEPKVMVAKELNVPFVNPEFLFEINTKDDLIPNLKKYLIGDWSGKLEDRLAEKQANGVVEVRID